MNMENQKRTKNVLKDLYSVMDNKKVLNIILKDNKNTQCHQLNCVFLFIIFDDFYTFISNFNIFTIEAYCNHTTSYCINKRHTWNSN